jgi:molybdopterin/thiamine biosynthesis adenylyltransferase
VLHCLPVKRSSEYPAFKRLIKLRPSRGALLSATNFSFWSYQPEARDSGPYLDPFAVDVLLIGCGAIGSGTGYVLSRLPVSGRAFTLDRQCFAAENFGTSIIIGEGDYEKPKAEVVATLLSAKLVTRALRTDIAQFQAQYDGGFPDIILTGLDDIDLRHQVQRLWPALIIDGAVGGELSCKVSCHPWSGQTACLLCLFQKQPWACRSRKSHPRGLA